jgi:adenylate cyclase
MAGYGHDAEDFGRALARQILVSARRRNILLAYVLSVVVVALTTVAFVDGVGGALRPKFAEAYPVAAPFLLGTIAYFLCVRAILGRRLKADRALEMPLRYVVSAIDTSIPLVSTVIAARVLGPLEALQGNTILLFFIFIILSPLQLEFRLSLFTGAVAAVEYVAVALYFLRITGVAPSAMVVTNPGLHVARGVILLVAGAVAGAVALQIRRQFEESVRRMQERNLAVSIFGQHVSPEVADMLLRQPVAPNGEARSVCVMFFDIRNFTAFSDQRTPAEVMAFLNTLFGPMVESVNRHNGIVNKFLGDGFMAVFGAPVASGEAARHAVAAAREMLARVDEMVQAGDIPPTRVGIGLHAGEAVTGNVGSERRKEYTVIGTVVNLASRIEALNKQYGSQFLVSQDVWSAVSADIGDHSKEAIDLGPVSIRGQDSPVRIFRLA